MYTTVFNTPDPVSILQQSQIVGHQQNGTASPPAQITE
jgi:hypothetical protein